MQQDFLLRPEQDRAILRYRVGRCPWRPSAPGLCSSRSPDREQVRLNAFGESDVGERQALALRYKGVRRQPVARVPVSRSRIFRMSKMQDFFSPSVQDQAILPYYDLHTL